MYWYLHILPYEQNFIFGSSLVLPTRISNYMHYKACDELLINLQTPTVQRLRIDE